MKTIYKIAGVTIVVVALFIIIGNMLKDKRNPYTPQTAAESYQEKVMTVAEAEQSQPMAFVSVRYEYNPTLFGNRWRIRGILRNKATVASYKDAVLNINFLSKTGTVLSTKEVTLYEIMYPTSTTPFDFKVDNQNGAAKIDLDFVSVVVN